MSKYIAVMIGVVLFGGIGIFACMLSSRISRQEEEHTLMITKIKRRKQWAVVDAIDPTRALAWIPEEVDPWEIARACDISIVNPLGSVRKC